MENNFIKGLLLIEKYDSGFDVAFEHDQAWFGRDGLSDEMDEEDKKLMAEYGFFVDSEFNCWSHF